MKLHLITLFILSLIGNAAQACSVSVNDLYQKNLMIGLAAAEMNLDLSKVTAISTSAYSKSFSGTIGPSACPTHLNTSIRANFTYKPNKFTVCQLSVTLNRSVQVGEELAPGAFETVTTALPASSCSPIVIFPH